MPSPEGAQERMPLQRRALILDHIRQRGAASIQELASSIGASVSTIRRDRGVGVTVVAMPREGSSR